MTAARACLQHGEWVDDGTTDGCPECLASWMYLYGRTLPDWPWIEAMARQLDEIVRQDRSTDLNV